MSLSEIKDQLAVHIRRAELSEQEQVRHFLIEAADWMESRQIGKWRRGMFTPELIQSYFMEREVYIAEVAGEPAGMFTLQAGDAEYWQHRNDENYLYLHRLTVASRFRSIGLGPAMLRWAEEYANQQGGKGLRLDCMADLLPLNRFYQQQDFRYMGTHHVSGKLASLYEKLPPAREHDIRLQYFTAKDYDQLLSWSGDAEFLLQWSGSQWKYPLQTTDLDAYLQNANDPSHSEQLIYTAVERSSGRAVGHIALTRIDRDNRSARISRVLVGDPEARGKGYGRRMIEEALRIGFDALGMHRITLAVLDYNTSAKQLYESCGFQQEGYLRDTMKLNDRYYSIYEMSILEDEWQAATSL
ncbi:GNAT family N-acetyltransferase [Paenibacillus sp. Z6-24]